MGMKLKAMFVLVLVALGMTVLPAVSAKPMGKGYMNPVPAHASTSTENNTYKMKGEEKWENAGERFEKAREWFNETRKKVEEARKQAREKRFEAWKKHLTAWVEVAKRWVERVEHRVQNLKLNNESKERLMSKLQEVKDRLNGIESEGRR